MKRLTLFVPAAAGLFLFGGCATRRAAYAPASVPEAAAVSEKWARYRADSLPHEPTELLYDADVSRRGLTLSGTLAVRDDPGKSLSVMVAGPMGLPLARADWNGVTTEVVKYGGRGGKKISVDPEDLGDAFGIPLSARALSLLFFGLPEETPPESVAVAGENAQLTWEGGNLLCEFDASARHARRIVARGPSRNVEVSYLAWNGALPTRIRVKVSSGGSADLSLRSPRTEAP